MPSPAPAVFYDQLVAHGLLVPTGAVGAFGRGEIFENVLEAFDRLVMRATAAEGVESMTFPPVIDRTIVERTGYIESFPTLCGAVHSFAGDERGARALAQRITEGLPWGQDLPPTDVVLNPAACYPFYPTCSGTVPPAGRHVTCLAWVYRQEPSNEPTRMRSFRVREFIRVGSPETVVAWRDAWLERGLAILTGLGLPARAEIASDPFFGRGGKILAAGQIEQRLKFEVLVPVVSDEHPTACCSFNYHQDKFGSAFQITLGSGETAHSACLGFGLERVTMALFKTHGFTPNTWPAAVRDQLWP